MLDAILPVLNVFLVYVMRHEDFYDVARSEIGTESGDVIFYSEIGVVFGIAFLAGMLHDVISPRLTLFLGFVVCGASIAAVPFGSTPVPYLVFTRLLNIIGVSGLLTSPLSIDYFTHDSQGAAHGWLYITI